MVARLDPVLAGRAPFSVASDGVMPLGPGGIVLGIQHLPDGRPEAVLALEEGVDLGLGAAHRRRGPEVEAVTTVAHQTITPLRGETGSDACRRAARMGLAYRDRSLDGAAHGRAATDRLVAEATDAARLPLVVGEAGEQPLNQGREHGPFVGFELRKEGGKDPSPFVEDGPHPSLAGRRETERDGASAGTSAPHDQAVGLESIDDADGRGMGETEGTAQAIDRLVRVVADGDEGGRGAGTVGGGDCRRIRQTIGEGQRQRAEQVGGAVFIHGGMICILHIDGKRRRVMCAAHIGADGVGGEC
jgi:hypothetical protein